MLSGVTQHHWTWQWGVVSGKICCNNKHPYQLNSQQKAKVHLESIYDHCGLAGRLYSPFASRLTEQLMFFLHSRLPCRGEQNVLKWAMKGFNPDRSCSPMSHWPKHNSHNHKETNGQCLLQMQRRSPFPVSIEWESVKTRRCKAPHYFQNTAVKSSAVMLAIWVNWAYHPSVW